jgi:hypothetical protein
MANISKKPDFIFLPSAVKESKAYSQTPNDGTGDFTFYRNSTTTRINERGQVENWPNNLITNSNNLSTINVVGATRTINATIAPNGLQEGALIREDSGYGYQHGLQSGTGQTLVTSTSAHHVSVYAKPYSNNRFLYFYFYFSDRTISFDMVTGAVVTTSTSFYNIKIEDAPYGWKRYSFNFTNQYTNQAGNFMVQGSPTDAYGLYFTGDGVSGIYLWGLQKTYDTGYIPYLPVGSTRLNLPTIDYSDGGPTLLLNPNRTNLVTYSQDFTNANWSKYNGATVNANKIIAPDGTLTGTQLNVSTTIYSGVYTIPIISSNKYTLSVFVKKGTKRWFYYVNPAGNAAKAWFDLDLGILGTVVSGYVATITPVSNGWYRCTLTNLNNEDGGNQFGFVDADNTTSASSTGYGYIWGAQTEVGLNASSYIPTIASTVTRALEGGITNFIPKSNRVTVYAEFKLNSATTSYWVLGFRPAGTDSAASPLVYDLYYWGAQSKEFGFNTWNGDSYGITNSTIGDGKYHKIIAVFDYTNFANNELYIDGVKQTISQVRGTTTQVTTKNNFSLISGNGLSVAEHPNAHYREIAIWDTELTDAECIDLTFQTSLSNALVNKHRQLVLGSGGVVEAENLLNNNLTNLK